MSHRIAVLRGGRLVAELPAAGADKADARRGDGRPRGGAGAPARSHARARRWLRAARRHACAAPARGRCSTASSSTLHAGEVVAIAGVAGNGQEALAELLCGQHALDAGTLTLAGRALPATPRAFVEAGVARIPEDRHAVGVVGDLPLWENAVLERYASPAFARHGIVRRERAMAHARSLVERFDVRGTESAGLGDDDAFAVRRQHAEADPRPRPGGGPRRRRRPPPLIVANQPTWGLDIGAVAYVHQQLLDACAQGSAVLLISEDLDEIFALADRIAVMHHGRLGAPRAARDWTLAAIGLAMAGGDARWPHAA